MTREDIDKIMDGESDFTDYEGKNRVLLGLNIIAKYIPNLDIEPAHDLIYSAHVDDVIDAGLTVEDALELRKIGWMIDDEYDCFAKFT